MKSNLAKTVAMKFGKVKKIGKMKPAAALQTSRKDMQKQADMD